MFVHMDHVRNRSAYQIQNKLHTKRQNVVELCPNLAIALLPLQFPDVDPLLTLGCPLVVVAEVPPLLVPALLHLPLQFKTVKGGSLPKYA